MPYWDERVDAMAKQYPQIQADKQHVDILAARFVYNLNALMWLWHQIYLAIFFPI